MPKHSVTEWFPPNVKPARIGVYERSPHPGSGGWFSKWNGGYWSHSYANAEAASKCTRQGMFQNWYWRGIKKEC